jgi:hypothetical protein
MSTAALTLRSVAESPAFVAFMCKNGFMQADVAHMAAALKDPDVSVALDPSVPVHVTSDDDNSCFETIVRLFELNKNVPSHPSLDLFICLSADDSSPINPSPLLPLLFSTSSNHVGRAQITHPQHFYYLNLLSKLRDLEIRFSENLVVKRPEDIQTSWTDMLMLMEVTEPIVDDEDGDLDEEVYLTVRFASSLKRICVDSASPALMQLVAREISKQGMGFDLETLVIREDAEYVDMCSWIPLVEAAGPYLDSLEIETYSNNKVPFRQFYDFWRAIGENCQSISQLSAELPQFTFSDKDRMAALEPPVFGHLEEVKLKVPLDIDRPMTSELFGQVAACLGRFTKSGMSMSLDVMLHSSSRRLDAVTLRSLAESAAGSLSAFLTSGNVSELGAFSCFLTTENIPIADASDYPHWMDLIYKGLCAHSGTLQHLHLGPVGTSCNDIAPLVDCVLSSFPKLTSFNPIDHSEGAGNLKDKDATLSCMFDSATEETPCVC